MTTQLNKTKVFDTDSGASSSQADQSSGLGARGFKDAPGDVLAPGDKLLHGQYQIDKYLNAGGFGITYLASDSLDRRVVIKECFPNSICCRSGNAVRVRSSSHQSNFRVVVRKFREEALRMAKLDHPNIVSVHQVFEDNETAYMALDFVAGQDLLSIIERDREKLSPSVIKTILLKLLDAIAYIHQNDILHRDIAPDNILLDDCGNPVLIDFGAAREVASRASRALSTMQVVKDGYSPQEFYIASGTQSESSDIYSLAATFYHLITGKAPPNSQVRLATLATDDIDPYVPIPPRTEGYDHFFLGAIDKALEVFPKDRLQTAVDWIQEIDKESRLKKLAEKAKADASIEFSIKQLLEETNKDKRAEAEARPKHEPERREMAAADPKTRPVKPEIVKGPAAVRPAVKVQAAGLFASSDLAAARQSVTSGEMPVSKNRFTDLALDTPESPPARSAATSRGRSFLSRIVSVPIWVITFGKVNSKHQNGGFERRNQ